MEASPCRYLQSVQHGAGLLQRHGGPGLQGLGWVGDFKQPPAQLLHHLSVALPLANQTVDDAPPLLRSPHHALPLVAQQSQFQVELVPAASRKERKTQSMGGWRRGNWGAAFKKASYRSSTWPCSSIFCPSLIMECRICCRLNISAWNNFRKRQIKVKYRWIPPAGSISIPAKTLPRGLSAAPLNCGSSLRFPPPGSPPFGLRTPSTFHTSPRRFAAAAGRTGACCEEPKNSFWSTVAKTELAFDKKSNRDAAWFYASGVVPEPLCGLGRRCGPAPVEVLHSFDLWVIKREAVTELIETLQLRRHTAEFQHQPLHRKERK